MRRFVAWPLLCATALLVGACASPTARFYTLTATAERAAGSAPAALSLYGAAAALGPSGGAAVHGLR